MTTCAFDNCPGIPKGTMMREVVALNKAHLAGMDKLMMAVFTGQEIDLFVKCKFGSEATVRLGGLVAKCVSKIAAHTVSNVLQNRMPYQDSPCNYFDNYVLQCKAGAIKDVMYKLLDNAGRRVTKDNKVTCVEEIHKSLFYYMQNPSSEDIDAMPTGVYFTPSYVVRILYFAFVLLYMFFI